MGDTRLVRIKPYDLSKGHVMKRYTAMGMRFVAAEGWYEVEKEIAAILAKVRQPPIGLTPPDSAPFAFDVKTSEAAIAMELEEERRKEVRAKAVLPRKMETTAAAVEATGRKARSSGRRSSSSQ